MYVKYAEWKGLEGLVLSASEGTAAVYKEIHRRNRRRGAFRHVEVRSACHRCNACRLQRRKGASTLPAATVP